MSVLVEIVQEQPEVHPVASEGSIAPSRNQLLLVIAGLCPLLGGVLVAKVAATLVGPSGVGLLATVQSVAGLVTLLADFNVGQGLVRQAPGGSLSRASATAARAITAVGGSVLVVVAFLLSPLLGPAVLGAGAAPRSFVLAAATGSLGMLIQQEVNIAAARRRIGSVARILIVQGLVAPSVTIAVLYIGGRTTTALAVLCGTGASLIIIGGVSRHNSFPRSPPAQRSDIRAAASALLRFGGPMTVAVLLGTGSQLVLPIIVRKQVGLSGAGFFRAATLVSMGYLAVLLTAMARDYYPRLGAETGPAGLQRTVDNQLRLALRVAAPLMAVAATVAPWLIRTLYSKQFNPAGKLLEIQIVGDVLKLAAWCFSYAILAKARTSIIVFLELVGAVALVSGTYVGATLGGLTGCGVGFVLAYALYLTAAAVISFRELDVRISTCAACDLLACLVCAALPSLARQQLPGVPGFLIGVAICLTALARALPVLRTMGAVPKAIVCENK